MASPGTVRPFVGDKLVAYMGSNCTIDDALASSTDSTYGTVWYSAASVTMISASTACTMSRTAAGDYSWITTAGGAETHYALCKPRLPTTLTASKGVKLTGFWISYALGVVDATSVTPTLNQTVYVNKVANAVTSYGGVLAYDATHNTAALRFASGAPVNPHLMNVTWPTTAYSNTGRVLLSVEVAFVLANTGTLKVNGYGFDYTFNYNGA